MYNVIPRKGFYPDYEIESRDKVRQDIQQQIEEFLANGGVITQLPHGATSSVVDMDVKSSFKTRRTRGGVL